MPTRPAWVAPVSLDQLRAVVAGIAEGRTSLEGDVGTQVRGLTLSSRSVQKGDMYAALPGTRTHGAEFAADAAGRGAVAALTDPRGADRVRDLGLPMIVVEAPRRVLGAAAAAIYGRPASRLTLIAVTGTQGKTTTTQLVVAGLEAAGRRSAVIGTMGTWIDGVAVSSSLTTPEAPDLHALFAVMVERSVDVCALEVSSHALVMGRVDGVLFDLSVFTNLGRDHLDFHADMDEYFAVKSDLFTSVRTRRALVNIDDEYGRRLVDHPHVEIRTFSTQGREADWTGTTLDADEAGTTFAVTGPDGRRVVSAVAMPGDFNVANAVCALASLGEVGVEMEAAAKGVAAAAPVAGRMQRVDRGQPFTVLVDYAHKPDAVRAILESLRPVTRGALIVVIGAGGERDRGKRPIMGEIAARLADLVLVTDDNPRSEDAAAIRAEIVAGAEAAGQAGRVLEIGDRRAAIRRALGSAHPGDTVLIAGKGHESGQEVAGETLPFDDRDVAAEILEGIVAGVGPQ